MAQQPNKNFPTQIGTEANWSKISHGFHFTVAIKSNGTLWSWGYNNDGRLGDGVSTVRIIPGRVGTDSDWAWVSASHGETFALKTNGTLWKWGHNSGSVPWLAYYPIQDGTIRIGNSSQPIQTVYMP